MVLVWRQRSAVGMGRRNTREIIWSSEFDPIAKLLFAKCVLQYLDHEILG